MNDEVILLVLIVSVLPGAAGQTYACPNFHTDRTACANTNMPSFTNIRDAFTTLNSLYFSTTILDVHSDVCSNLGAVKAFTVCLDGATQNCTLQSSPRATVQQINTGMDYFCQNIADVDVSCFTSRLKQGSDCVNAELSEHSVNGTQLEVVCKRLYATIDCTKIILENCPKPRTGEIFVKWFKMVNPKECNSGVEHALSVSLLVAVLFACLFF